MNAETKLPVLLVEANPTQSALLKLALNRIENLQVYHLAEGEEVIPFIQKNRPLIVIIDLFLPGVNGLHLVEQVKKLEIPRRPRIMVLSSLGYPVVVRQIAQIGVDDFLVKPVNTDVFVERVRKILKEQVIGRSL
ncbi:MAG: response regulator [Chloroflexi bacterium]|nr:response regulator [Chloroflexota bacterium]